MRLIPVVDIKGGVVVHARAGERDRYQAIETPLSKSADPLSVIEGLCSLYAFDTLYLADLDGIQHGAPDEATQARILDAWPGTRVLVDDGRVREGALFAHAKRRCVLGSESVTDLSALAHAEVLSLDFKGDDFLGPAQVLETPQFWPSEVIVMTLGAVGMKNGPDLEHISDVVGAASGRLVYAAGGVRGIEDLKAISRAGARGALVATALHSGQIKARDLEEIAGSSF